MPSWTYKEKTKINLHERIAKLFLRKAAPFKLGLTLLKLKSGMFKGQDINFICRFETHEMILFCMLERQEITLCLQVREAHER